MGISQETCSVSEAPNTPSAFGHYFYEPNEFKKVRPSLRSMIWDLGLSCFLPKGGHSDENDDKDQNLEHNKAWLLAESGGCGARLTSVDPQSVHSSFRFSICSQVELESMNLNSSNTATVLMVNLDNGLESHEQEQKWRRIESLEKSITPLTNTLIRFSYSQIVSATRNFSKGRVLGRGALSYVFRGRIGVLRTSVAVKRLDKEDKECAKAFCRELMIASSLRHPNVAPLVGFCMDSEEGFFLVYKYVSGGNLERHLHDRKKGPKGRSAFPWSMRYKVAVGIAEAIAYLHSGTERCVVHRDIKPSNILLSANKKPKLCDFGLATWTPAPSIPFLCKTVKGTFGYLAPEYFQHGKVSDKMDVYAFGVVLLELITGRKPIEARRPSGEENLVLWAKPLLNKGIGAIEELADPRLTRSLKSPKQIARMIQAAAACIINEESRRPGIDKVAAILRGDDEPILASKKKSSFRGNGFVLDYFTQLHQTKSEMNKHLALAMLGVSEFEDDDYFCYQ
ncbi:hypothetical protein BT93_E2939 [Corymbia citriodora subsp. variegata]|nr:hypothetical protein BT93_E2939 [Corymbia citriodora subsp. variegata]